MSSSVGGEDQALNEHDDIEQYGMAGASFVAILRMLSRREKWFLPQQSCP